jgi:serine/threonine protein kinase
MKCLVGTEDYQAPEMREDAFISTAVDIWAYGIVLYEMAVGYHPKKIKHLQLPKLTEKIPYFKKHWIGKDPNLIDLIKRCLQTEPSDRISAEEALTHPYFLHDDEIDESDVSHQEDQS